MNNNILNVKKNILTDESITGIQYHSYNPYTTSYNNNDEIRIAIQQQDIYTLPHESFIYIEGTVTKATNAAENAVMPSFINNRAAFLFDEIRYELNSFEIDRCKNVGITSTIKGYISFTANDMNRLQTAGWTTSNLQAITPGHFSYLLPLKTLLGFAEDYKTIILNAKQELIIIRNRSDINSVFGVSDIATINIHKIQWRVPHVQVSDSEKLSLLKYVEKQQPIQIPFRSWEIYEYPTLPQTNKHIWSVKATSQVNRPRYIILAFQKNRSGNINSDASKFDHCDIRDIKIYLNSECYPYENMNLNFNRDLYSVVYDMYASFQNSYYHDQHSNSPLLTFSQFKTEAPIYVFDCSRQNESLKKAIVDIRVEIYSNTNITAGTTAYCLIIHDNLITYNPYTNIVSKSL